jgi:hypothetical protein
MRRLDIGGKPGVFLKVWHTDMLTEVSAKSGGRCEICSADHYRAGLDLVSYSSHLLPASTVRLHDAALVPHLVVGGERG